jgi:hypothetical protein
LKWNLDCMGGGVDWIHLDLNKGAC